MEPHNICVSVPGLFMRRGSCVSHSLRSQLRPNSEYTTHGRCTTNTCGIHSSTLSKSQFFWICFLTVYHHSFTVNIFLRLYSVSSIVLAHWNIIICKIAISAQWTFSFFSIWECHLLWFCVILGWKYSGPLNNASVRDADCPHSWKLHLTFDSPEPTNCLLGLEGLPIT